MEMDVWIEFDEPIVWKGNSSKNNDSENKDRPVTRSPFFPLGHDSYDLVSKIIGTKKYEYGQRDALTYYVKVPKSEIVNLVKKLIKQNKMLTHFKEILDDLLVSVEALPDDKIYTLVQDEF